MTKTIDELKIIGEEIWKSQMFGVRNPSEGFIVAAICDEEKISFLKFREDYTMIMGNIGKRADAILASFQECDGTHKIIEKTSEKCVIEFVYKKEKYTSVCDWADLIKEPFTHTTKSANGQALPPNMPMEQRPLKDKYATPYSRRQMLFARCVSDGVRTICPIACKGRYTPEEISDFTDTDEMPHIDNQSQATTAAPTMPPQEKPQEVKKVAAPPIDTPKETKPQETPANAPNAVDVDYSICRIPACDAFGRKWNSFATDELKVALEQLPLSDTFTTIDRENITAILEFRKKQDALNNPNIPADN